MAIIQTVVAGGGVQPTGTKNITANGIYDVTNYASADVQVPTTAPACYRAFEKDANDVLITSKSTPFIPLPTGTKDVSASLLSGLYKECPANVVFGAIDLSSLTSVNGGSAMYQMFYGSLGVTSVDLSSLESVYGTASAMAEMFSGCTGLTSADMRSLYDVGGANACKNMFYGCTNLTSVNLGKLETVGGLNRSGYGCERMFFGCTSLTTIDLSSLVGITGQYGCHRMFENCTGITSADVSSLAGITTSYAAQYMFNGCTGLTSIDLSSLTIVNGQYAANGMFYGCANLATVDISHLCKIIGNYAMQGMFGATAITSLSFPGLAFTNTNFNSSFYTMLSGCSGVTVHFPAEWETTMGSWSNVTNGFGGTNTTVLFDLPNVTTLNLSHITKIPTPYLFNEFAQNNYFSNITSVDLSNLKSVTGQNACGKMFSGCTNLTSINLNSLEEVTTASCGSMFSGCTGLTSVSFPALKTIYGNNATSSMFSGCTNLTSVSFPVLETVRVWQATQYMFQNCTSLTTLSFPALKNVDDASAFSSMLAGVTGCTVHFPSNLSSLNIQNSIGGTNTTVLYDLPATE